MRIIGSQDAEKMNAMRSIPNGNVVTLPPDPILTIPTTTVNDIAPTIPVIPPVTNPAGSLTTTTAVSIHNPPPSGYPVVVYVIGDL